MHKTTGRPQNAESCFSADAHGKFASANGNVHSIIQIVLSKIALPAETAYHKAQRLAAPSQPPFLSCKALILNKSEIYSNARSFPCAFKAAKGSLAAMCRPKNAAPISSPINFNNARKCTASGVVCPLSIGFACCVRQPTAPPFYV